MHVLCAPRKRREPHRRDDNTQNNETHSKYPSNKTETTTKPQFYGHDWPSSKIWSDDWFGASSVNTTGRVINTGRWAYTPVHTDHDAPERNGYGRLTDRMNADPVKYVTRGASSVCGVATRATLPGCAALHRAVSSETLEQVCYV